VYTPAPPTFEQRWKRFKSDSSWRTNHIEASIVFLPWVRKPATKCLVCPLDDQIPNSAEERISVDLPFLHFNAADLAESILIVLENSTRKELIKDLSLPARKRH
jgi:hypothetical protein